MNKGNAFRIGIVFLSLSAGGYVATISSEGYTNNTIIPTQGDVPTNGFGSTVKEDGTRVQMGEVVTPVKAAKRALIHIQRDETALKKCIFAPLAQGEYDAYVKLTYNIGAVNFCTSAEIDPMTGQKTGKRVPSTISKRINAQDYVGACKAILDYKIAAGYDCSTPGNKRCYGLWKSRLELHDACMSAQ